MRDKATMDNEMTMLVGFTDGSQSFVNGFEAGMIWQRMQDGERVIDCGIVEGFPIHDENVEVLKRMAAAEKYQVEVGRTADGWTAMRFDGSSGTAAPKLSIVGGCP